MAKVNWRMNPFCRQGDILTDIPRYQMVMNFCEFFEKSIKHHLTMLVQRFWTDRRQLGTCQIRLLNFANLLLDFANSAPFISTLSKRLRRIVCNSHMHLYWINLVSGRYIHVYKPVLGRDELANVLIQCNLI